MQSSLTEYAKATGTGCMPLPVVLLLVGVEVTGCHCLFPHGIDGGSAIVEFNEEPIMIAGNLVQGKAGLNGVIVHLVLLYG